MILLLYLPISFLSSNYTSIAYFLQIFIIIYKTGNATLTVLLQFISFIIKTFFSILSWSHITLVINISI